METDRKTTLKTKVWTVKISVPPWYPNKCLHLAHRMCAYMTFLLNIHVLLVTKMLIESCLTVSCSSFEVPVLQYSQRHTVINHSDRCYHPPG